MFFHYLSNGRHFKEEMLPVITFSFVFGIFWYFFISFVFLFLMSLLFFQFLCRRKRSSLMLKCYLFIHILCHLSMFFSPKKKKRKKINLQWNNNDHLWPIWLIIQVDKFEEGIPYLRNIMLTPLLSKHSVIYF